MHVYFPINSLINILSEDKSEYFLFSVIQIYFYLSEILTEDPDRIRNLFRFHFIETDEFG